MQLYEIKPTDIEKVEEVMKKEEIIEGKYVQLLVVNRFNCVFGHQLSYIEEDKRDLYLHALKKGSSVFVESDVYERVFDLKKDTREEDIDRELSKVSA